MKIIAIDIGGTEIKSGIIEFDKILSNLQTKTDISQGLDSIKSSIIKSIDSHNLKGVSGIAISSAGTIDPFKGICTFATNNLPGYTGFDIKSFIENRYGLKTSVINDAQGALLGEIQNDKSLTQGRVAMLTLGTGVGGAIANNGEIIFGEDFEYGRLGHYEFIKNGLLCNCGKTGCYEQYISATSLVKLAVKNGLDVKNAKQIFDNNDKKEYLNVIKEYCNTLSLAINKLMMYNSINTIILGGGIISAYNKMKEYINIDKSLKLTTAKLENMAGMLGAYCWLNKFN